jgi:beta-D-xylosidase 4
LGPNALATDALLANYYGNPEYIVSICDGISKSTDAQCVQGCDINSSSTKGFAAACKSATNSDVTVLVMGIDLSIEREGRDRLDISLPGQQYHFIKAMQACSKLPVILVIVSGGPVDISSSLIGDKEVGAILWAGYGGQEAGQGLADIIFGSVSPSGLLTSTWYQSNFVNDVSMENMNMRPSNGYPGRGYRYYIGQVVYPFGYGLSYTTFKLNFSIGDSVALEAASVQSALDEHGLALLRMPTVVSTSAVVTNTGNVTSDLSVLLFLAGPNAGKDGNPIRSLADFQRVYQLAPGTSKTVRFGIKAWQFAKVSEDGPRKVVRGRWEAMIGDISLPILIY